MVIFQKSIQNRESRTLRNGEFPLLLSLLLIVVFSHASFAQDSSGVRRVGFYDTPQAVLGVSLWLVTTPMLPMVLPVYVFYRIMQFLLVIPTTKIIVVIINNSRCFQRSLRKE